MTKTAVAAASTARRALCMVYPPREVNWYHERRFTMNARQVEDSRQAYHALQTKYARLEAICRLIDRMSRAATLDDVFAEALDGIQSAAGAHRVAAMTIEPDGKTIVRAARGLPSDACTAKIEAMRVFPPSARAIEPIFVDDLARNGHE